MSAQTSNKPRRKRNRKRANHQGRSSGSGSGSGSGNSSGGGAKKKQGGGGGMLPPEVQELVDSKIAELTLVKERQQGMSKKAADEFAKKCRQDEQGFKSLIEKLGDIDGKISTDLLTMFKAQVEKSKRIERSRQSGDERLRNVTSEKLNATIELRRTQKNKDQIELLCQDIQQKNAALVEQNKRTIEQEEERRQELIKSFDNSFKEISAKIEEQSDASRHQAEENVKLRENFAKCLDADALRQEEYTKVQEARMEERRIFEGHKKHYEKLNELQEKEVADLKKQLHMSLLKEQELAKKVGDYAQKFDEVSTTLNESSRVLEQFNKAQDELTKRGELLDRAKRKTEARNQKMDLALLKIMKEKKSLQQQNIKLLHQKENLSGLCRRLQEQNHFIKQKVERLEIQISCVQPDEAFIASLEKLGVEGENDSGQCEKSTGSSGISTDHPIDVRNEFNEVD